MVARAYADSPATPHPDLERWIAALKANPPSPTRDEQAYDLWLCVNAGLKLKYSDAEIDDIASLLSDRNGVVVFWAAASLGRIGSSAHRAEPALQAALRAEECEFVAAHIRRRMSMSAVDAVMGAMIHIGIQPKPLHCSPEAISDE